MDNDNRYKWIGDVNGAKTGKPFGVWWYKSEEGTKGAYEVKRQAGDGDYSKEFINRGMAKDVDEALQKAQNDVAAM
ncbi:MAG: hypothetical protein KF726_09020 [Anaerolineae bacterium]|nr:hypothetical protein [Anaerolineae bacterium]